MFYDAHAFPRQYHGDAFATLTVKTGPDTRWSAPL
jgi:hypothetical protein